MEGEALAVFSIQKIERSACRIRKSKGGDKKMEKTKEIIKLIVDCLKAILDGKITPEEFKQIEIDIQILLNKKEKE